MATHDVPETPSPGPDSPRTPSTPGNSSPGSPSPKKFNWLRQQKARNNPFVKPRPSLTRESSTAELFSRENSSSDFFQNSRLNLFDTPAPRPEVSQGFKKVIFNLINHVISLIFIRSSKRNRAHD